METQTIINEDSEYKKVCSELVEARDVVRECLTEDARCRNDDRWLMLKVWQKQGIMIMIDFEKWKDMFAPETIRRVRQEIQSTHNGQAGELLPTDPDVLILRKVREQAIRNYYGNQSYIMREFQNKKYGVR